KLRVYGDSSLIINQISGKWKVRSESLAPYQSYLEKLSEQVEELCYTYLPREENQFADALAKLASMINISNGMDEMLLTIETRQEAAYVHAIDDVEPDNDEPWFIDIQRGGQLSGQTRKPHYQVGNQPNKKSREQQFHHQLVSNILDRHIINHNPFLPLSSGSIKR
ncbi:hypothetical protein SOVF_121910, partial [Spinacia oleracea]